MRNTILAVIFGAGLISCGIWLVIYFTGKNEANTELNDLKDAYVEIAEPIEEIEPEQTEEDEEQDTQEDESVSENQEPETIRVTDDLSSFSVPDKKIDFSALQKENPDIYSWITIPGTVIDYPIVQDADELDYYLMHNLNGSYGYPGCIYTQYLNTMDWMDSNTVIYGHNMKDGSMFAALHHYQDKEFFEAHPYVYVYSSEEIMVYRIFAAYETSDMHLLLTFDMENEENFEGYLKGILENEEGMGNHFDKTIDLYGNDKIISLETCISNKS